MSNIKNPILSGFNPDPSIIRVEDYFYIATSTFEWFPGVQIHRSKDLKNWELVSRALTNRSQLDMIGNPDSCGVWAPCLSYDNGTFYLVYTNVRSFDGVWKDTPNFLVTTTDILGEWSDPIYLSSHGFDGSLFHDDDGRKWFTSMLVDHRKGKFFGGIIMQQFDQDVKRLVGPVHHIHQGTELGKTEGPHLYKRKDYYYLLMAEGGTEYGHSISFARSKELTGPYELHPQNPIISVKDSPSYPIQKSGHGDLVETKVGNVYMVFLIGRPLTDHGRCILGRETAIEQMEWHVDDWLYPKAGTRVPRLEVSTDLEEFPVPISNTKDDFDSPHLDIQWQSLRRVFSEDWMSLKKRPGYLRLYGQESLSSFHYQSHIGRRLQHFHASISTKLDFKPITFQQMAGLVIYYNTCHFHYLYMTSDENGRRLLNIITCDKYNMKEPISPVVVLGEDVVYLRAEINLGDLQFLYSVDEKKWINIGPILDLSILSDDYVRDEENRYRPAFTGTFVGLCCQDLSGQKVIADFDWFEYKGINQS
ncbi:MAG: glycoside hydrolase family 43 protein [Cyclobacteriaceae bacterium]